MKLIMLNLWWINYVQQKNWGNKQNYKINENWIKEDNKDKISNLIDDLNDKTEFCSKNHW